MEWVIGRGVGARHVRARRPPRPFLRQLRLGSPARWRRRRGGAKALRVVEVRARLGWPGRGHRWQRRSGQWWDVLLGDVARCCGEGVGCKRCWPPVQALSEHGGRRRRSRWLLLLDARGVELKKQRCLLRANNRPLIFSPKMPCFVGPGSAIPNVANRLWADIKIFRKCCRFRRLRIDFIDRSTLLVNLNGIFLIQNCARTWLRRILGCTHLVVGKLEAHKNNINIIARSNTVEVRQILCRNLQTGNILRHARLCYDVLANLTYFARPQRPREAETVRFVQFSHKTKSLSRPATAFFAEKVISLRTVRP